MHDIKRRLILNRTTGFKFNQETCLNVSIGRDGIDIYIYIYIYIYILVD